MSQEPQIFRRVLRGREDIDRARIECDSSKDPGLMHKRKCMGYVNTSESVGSPVHFVDRESNANS